MVAKIFVIWYLKILASCKNTKSKWPIFPSPFDEDHYNIKNDAVKENFLRNLYDGRNRYIEIWINLSQPKDEIYQNNGEYRANMFNFFKNNVKNIKNFGVILLPGPSSGGVKITETYDAIKHDYQVAGGSFDSVAGFMYMPNHQSMREAKNNKNYWDSITTFRSLLFKFYENNLITAYEPLNSLFHDPFDGAKSDDEKKEKFNESVFNILTGIYASMRVNFKFFNNQSGSTSGSLPSELAEFFTSKPEPASKVQVENQPDKELDDFKKALASDIAEFISKYGGVFKQPLNPPAQPTAPQTPAKKTAKEGEKSSNLGTC